MSRLHALMVEDSVDDYDLLVRALGRGGYELRSQRVDREEDLRRALAQGPWDIVFSDWAMPRFSAPRALEVVQEHGLDVPFIIVSGTIGEDVAVAALQAGACDFMNKDQLARLLPAVERELREARVRRERAEIHDQLLVSERLASIGMIAASVGHEINNPLATITANLELATRELDGILPAAYDGVRQQLDDAHDAALRIKAITDDLRLFARASATEPAPIDVGNAVQSALRLSAHQVQDRATVHVDLGPLPPVAIDESKLGQVVMNLVVNAAQALPADAGQRHEIHVRAASADDDVVIEVTDTGPGIPDELRDTIFQPFVSGRVEGEGLGLGLWICRRILAEAGGTIEVADGPQAGAVFRIRLPASRAAEADVEADAAPEEAPVAVDRARILVIDDEKPLRTTLQFLLEGQHDVVTVAAGREAQDLFDRGERFDLVLCDLMMPDVSGMALHAHLAVAAPDQAARMMFITGGAFTPAAREFVATTDLPVVEKPFNVHGLLRQVNERVQALSHLTPGRPA